MKDGVHVWHFFGKTPAAECAIQQMAAFSANVAAQPKPYDFSSVDATIASIFGEPKAAKAAVELPKPRFAFEPAVGVPVPLPGHRGAFAEPAVRDMVNDYLRTGPASKNIVFEAKRTPANGWLSMLHL